jgi:epoxyqueuosine reductase
MAALPRPEDLLDWLREEAVTLGFSALGVTDTALTEDAGRLRRWLADGLHGGEDGALRYLGRHLDARCEPERLRPGTLRVLSLRMDYWPSRAHDPWRVLDDGRLGYIARYTLGRDYHRTIRPRLQRLCDTLVARIGPCGYRVYVDSAPVLERALARKAGLGWVGKHTNLIHREAGSYFLLGEIYTDLPLPLTGDGEHPDLCGSCSACIEVCPTRAIVAPYRLDATRCIPYLTIESKAAIPEPIRPLIGNRIFGCDDCQLVCPWNRYAGRAVLPDFSPRHGLDAPPLTWLMGWSETDYLHYTEGSALRRIGYPGWLRNVAVALGNGPAEPAAIAALEARRDHASALVREHVGWALARLAAAPTAA